MRIVTWNIERHPPTSTQARTLMTRIRDAAPDVVCLTEAHAGSFGGLEGHVLSALGARWANEAETERKVVLWSKSPWSNPLALDDLSDIGGAIAATTETSLGTIQVVAVCIPYHLASPTGLEPRARMWSQHLEFLDKLRPVLGSLDPSLPIVLMGDFNLRIPPDWGPHDVRARMNEVLHGLTVVTQGLTCDADGPTIDHIAVSSRLRAAEVRCISRFDTNETALSDHFGVFVELEAGGVQIFD